MKQHRWQILIPAMAMVIGFCHGGRAQQPTPPDDPAETLKPVVPNQKITSMGGAVSTLPTTMVETQKKPQPNQKITADQYYSEMGTTGSYRVNKARAKADQEAALNEARRRKMLMERAASTGPYRMNYRTSDDFMKANPPTPDPEPAAEAPAEPAGNPPTDPEPDPGPEEAAAEEEIEFVKIRGGGGGSIAGRIRYGAAKRKGGSETNDGAPVFDDGNVNPSDQMQQAPAPPELSTFAPTEVGPGPRPSTPGSSDAPPRGLFSRLRQSSADSPPSSPMAEAVPVEAVDVPQFDVSDEEMNLPSEALNAPQRKGLSFLFGRKKKPATPAASNPPSQQRSVPAAPSTYAPTPVPPPAPAYAGGSQAPPPIPAGYGEKPASPSSTKPMINSIFRPNATAQRAGAFSVVQGDEVYANVGGEQVLLSPGTRVKVLRTGTDRSLVRLFDSRQATIANSALKKENP